ncbi:unnamed protein product [Gemmata massiliana]|uniref:DUF4190 domain-containing protein n=1 Tax=Gemmata massiliana TaxID=1210884 RepID=A0A6P2CTV8_9BACT|nr:hypothetical protein [Gemmata massiliana]VTR92343.1 unnamed protein product [Gemmata massiliana]
MEHPPAAPAPAPGTRSPNDSYVARGLAGASVGMGFFSACVFWWTPFTSILATVGLTLGLISVLRGVKGGLRGENYAMVGTILCATSLTITVTLNQGLRYAQWDSFPWLW